MSTRRIIGILLLVAGALSLAYGGFSYTRETHDAKIGPIEISLSEKESFHVPVWAGIACLVGGLVLVVGRPRG